MQHYYSEKIIKELNESCIFRHEPIGSTSKLLSLYSLQHEEKEENIIHYQLYENEESHLKSTSETERKFSKFEGFTNRKVKINQEAENESENLCENVKSESSTSEMKCFGYNKGRAAEKGENECENDTYVRSIKRQQDIDHQIKKFKSMDNLDRKYERHSKFIPKSTFLKIKFREEEQLLENELKNQNKNEPKSEVKNYRLTERTSIKEAEKSSKRKIQINDIAENTKDQKCFNYCQNCIKTQMNRENLRTVMKQILGICERIKNEKEKFKKEIEEILGNVLNFQNEFFSGMSNLWHQFLDNCSKQRTSIPNEDLDIIQSINLNQSETYSNNTEPNLIPLNQPTTSSIIEAVKISIDKKTCTSLPKKTSNLEIINETEFELYNSEENFYIPIIAQNESNFEVLNSMKIDKQETSEEICSNTPKIEILTQSYDFDLEEEIDTLFPKKSELKTLQKIEEHVEEKQTK